MNASIARDLKLGINGLGRIGKLSVWYHVARKYFDEIVVNIGREVGKSLSDVANYLERDSTYGWLHSFLHGYNAERVITNIDENAGSMIVNGIKVRFLRKHRNPLEIGWGEHDVRVVVDTTSQFLDPNLEPDHPQGSLRGHIESESGCEKL